LTPHGKLISGPAFTGFCARAVDRIQTDSNKNMIFEYNFFMANNMMVLPIAGAIGISIKLKFLLLNYMFPPDFFIHG
jgi:hypothetical protein